MDPYETLGIARNATSQEVKRAYQKLASQHHPDRGGNAQKAAEINDAYACLSDPERRADFDRGGHGGAQTPEERAFSIFLGAVTSNIGQPSALGAARTMISRGITKSASDISICAREIRTLEKTTFKRKSGGPCLLQDIVDQALVQKKTQMATLESFRDDQKRALAMLDDYEESGGEAADLKPAAKLPYSAFSFGA